MAKIKMLFITLLHVTGISQPIIFLFVHDTPGYHHGRNKPGELICSSSYIIHPLPSFKEQLVIANLFLFIYFMKNWNLFSHATTLFLGNKRTLGLRLIFFFLAEVFIKIIRLCIYQNV